MLLITLGDPFSVNIELVLRFFSSMREKPQSGEGFPIVLIGSYWHWNDQQKKLGLPKLELQPITSLLQAKEPIRYFLDISPQYKKTAEKLSHRERGAIALAALESIPSHWNPQRRLAVLTCPINKSACREAGFAFPGQTEFFENRWSGKSLMILAGPILRVALVTNHLSLKEVTPKVTSELVSQKLELFLEALTKYFNIKNPRVAICGLNPHCGEGGLFGNEDTDEIKTALKESSIRLKKRGHGEAFGPFSADTIFHKALSGEYDGILAMYHDQGLGPLKTVHFYDAINLTGGLNHLRVSCDHGTAEDLYLLKRADTRSFTAAFSKATDYLTQINR